MTNECTEANERLKGVHNALNPSGVRVKNFHRAKGTLLRNLHR